MKKVLLQTLAFSVFAFTALAQQKRQQRMDEMWGGAVAGKPRQKLMGAGTSVEDSS